MSEPGDPQLLWVITDFLKVWLSWFVQLKYVIIILVFVCWHMSVLILETKLMFSNRHLARSKPLFSGVMLRIDSKNVLCKCACYREGHAGTTTVFRGCGISMYSSGSMDSMKPGTSRTWSRWANGSAHALTMLLVNLCRGPLSSSAHITTCWTQWSERAWVTILNF